MVEHSAVNRVVVGSSPTRGAVRIIMIVKQEAKGLLLMVILAEAPFCVLVKMLI